MNKPTSITLTALPLSGYDSNCFDNINATP